MKNDWSAALSRVLAKEADIVPKDFETIEQIAKKLGRKKNRTRELVNKLSDQKLAERKKFRLIVNGTLRTVSHYRLI